MQHPHRMRRNCTLCKGPFTLHGPHMAHPADLICNDCVAGLWRDRRPDSAIETELTALIDPNLGFSPDLIAMGVTRRLAQLRDLATTESELWMVLHERDPDWEPPN